MAQAASNVKAYRQMLITGQRVLLPDTFKDIATVAVGSIVTLWTPATGKRIRVLGASLSVSAAVSLLFEDNAAGAGNFLFRTPVLVANTPYELALGQFGFALSAVDNVLKVTGSGAANLTGTVWGVEEI